MITEFYFMVAGRPAPQGSKRTGAHGQMREASPYLPAWRAAVKEAVYRRYKVLGVVPAALPLLRGPIGFSATFFMPDGVPVDAAPDLDKLLRSTWDALGSARVWEDDGRVTLVSSVEEVPAGDRAPGADIHVWLRGSRWEDQ